MNPPYPAPTLEMDWRYRAGIIRNHTEWRQAMRWEHGPTREESGRRRDRMRALSAELAAVRREILAEPRGRV